MDDKLMEAKHTTIAATLPTPPPCLPRPEVELGPPCYRYRREEPDSPTTRGNNCSGNMAGSEKKQSNGHGKPCLQPEESDAESQVLPGTLDVDAPPDGGTTAWLVVLGAWCVSFCSYGWINSESDHRSLWYRDD